MLTNLCLYGDKMLKVEKKKIDPQGRIILPKKWREKTKNKEVIIVQIDDKIHILRKDADLEKYIDAVELEISEFEDYHNFKKELRKYSNEIC